MADVTDRQKLDLTILSTVQFEFGSICDEVDRLVRAGSITVEVGQVLKRNIRFHGNNVVRVVGNHLDFYNVSRNHRKDQPNIPSVVRRAQKG